MHSAMRKVRDIVGQLSRLSSSSSSASHTGLGGYAYITPSNEMPRAVPVLYPLFRGCRIDRVSLGNGFVVGSYQQGTEFKLCAYGVNRVLQLGSPSENTIFEKKIWGIDERVVQLKSGRAHSLGLTESGRMFGWGSNNMGQLGFLRDSVKGLPFTFLDHKGNFVLILIFKFGFVLAFMDLLWWSFYRL